MLLKATLEDIEKYGDMAYGLALNPKKSSYPTYADGIKTKADFIDAATRSVTKDTSQLLLFVLDGTVEGWIQYFWISEDHYLQLTACNINRGMEQALTELLELLQKDFPGHTAYFGFPGENAEAVSFLRKQGFRCIEEDWNHSFFFESYTPLPDDEKVTRITCDNYDNFRAVYHAEPETYWNSDRILETIDDWLIFAYHQNEVPVAVIFLQGDDGYYEIYGMEFVDGTFREAAFRALLTAALNGCKRMGAKYMTYFCGEEERRILPEFGFHCVGQYVLYIKKLGNLQNDGMEPY